MIPSVESLNRLINKGVEAKDPLAVAALAEWLVLTAGIAGVAHLLNHIDQDVLAQAMEDAMNCNREGSTANTH